MLESQRRATRVTITLELQPQVESCLRALAQAADLSMEDYLGGLITSSLPRTTLAEAIELYAARAVSQGQAAALAGVSRREFIDALGKAGVPVFQYDAAEALEEAF